MSIHPKLRGNCAFPQNFHTTKSGETSVFYAADQFISPFPLRLTKLLAKVSLFKCSKTNCHVKNLVFEIARALTCFHFHVFF